MSSFSLFSRYSTKDVAGYQKMLHDIKWNREGNYIGMISSDKTVKVGQLEKNGSFQNVHTIPNSLQMTQLCWNPNDDSQLGICGDDKQIELWDVRASRASAKIAAVGHNINIAWSPCSNYMTVGNKNDIVCLLDIRKGSLMAKKKFAYEVNELAWTANPQYFLATTGRDGMGSLDVVSCWGNDDASATITTANRAVSMEVIDNSAASTAKVTTGTSTGGAMPATPSQLSVVSTITGHVSNCINLRVDSRFRRFAVAGLDYAVSFWDLENLACITTISLESEIRSLSFSGDGSYLAVIAEDPTVLIVSVSSICL